MKTRAQEGITTNLNSLSVLSIDIYSDHRFVEFLIRRLHNVIVYMLLREDEFNIRQRLCT